MKLLLMVLMFGNYTLVHAYNDETCIASFKSAGSLFISPIQFTSSWGPCSPLGLNDKQQFNQFYSINKDEVLNEMSAGKGEYLQALIMLSQCTDVDSLKTTLQKSYSTIYKFTGDELLFFIYRSCLNKKI